jgi:hypothetical protein
MSFYRVFKLFIVLFLSFKGLSFNSRIIDTAEIHSQIKLFNINKNVLNFSAGFFRDIIYKNDSVIIYNPDGTLHLFEISIDKKTKVSKLSKSLFHGANFGRLLFTHNDIVYSYGGGGLFNRFTGLIYFEPDAKGWFEKKIIAYPKNATEIINTWKNGDKLMVVLGRNHSTTSQPLDLYTDFSFGEIHLESLRYTNLSNFTSSNKSELYFPSGDYRYDLNNFIFFGHKEKTGLCRYSIFNKSTGEFFAIPILQNMECFDGIKNITVIDSILRYTDDLGISDSINIYKYHKIFSRNYFDLYNKKDKTFPFCSFIAMALLVVLLITLWVRKNRKTKIIETDEIIEIETQLIGMRNNTLSRDKIDTVFQISHYSYDTRKSKRSQMVIQINNRGRVSIERIRKENDKRFYDYRIS